MECSPTLYKNCHSIFLTLFVPFLTRQTSTKEKSGWVVVRDNQSLLQVPISQCPEKGVEWFYNFYWIEKDTDTLQILIQKDRKNSWEALSVMEKLMILWFIQEKHPITFDNCKADTGTADPVRLTGSNNDAKLSTTKGNLVIPSYF
jgi:hypothetical protein